MNKKFLKVITVLMLIITLTMANFVLICADAVTYAASSVGKDNCTISAYFIDENGNKNDKLETSISNENIKLGLDIKVSDQGYFNGEISLNNSNFKLNTNVQNEHINSISENKITLNQINAGDTIALELAIEPIKDDMYDLSMLNRDTEVEMAGTYVAGNNKNYKIDKKQNVTLSLVSPYQNSDVDKLNLQAQNVTNKVYNINGENKRLVQFEVTSNLADNAFPIKNTKITLDVLDNVEDIKVAKRGTFATNTESEVKQNWDKEGKKLELDIANDANNESKVQWNKTGNDKILVTYILGENENITTNSINAEETIELYDVANTAITKRASVADLTEKDGGISYSLSATNELYKGNMYYGEDTNYQENTAIDIRYPQIAKDISITQGNSTYVINGKETAANSKYVKTTVNKSDLSNILGKTGTLNIKDANGTVIASATTQSITDSGDNVEFNYAEQNSIVIEIQNAHNEGTLTFVNDKKINETNNYSKDQMKTFTSLKTNSSLQADANVGSQTSEVQTNLLEPVTYATFTSNTSELSTLQTNENVEYNVILKTDDIKYDLYKNPSIEVIFPKEITSIDEQTKPVFIEGFTITENKIEKNAAGNYVLRISLQGEQTAHSNNISEGIIINVNANIGIDKNISTRASEIVLHYTNANAGAEVYEQKLPITLKSKEGLLFYDKVENYNANGDTLESISDETQQGNLDTGVEARTLADSITLVNNYDVPLTNVSLTVQNNSDANLALSIAKDIKFAGIQPTITYTEDGTNWVANAASLKTIKAYKIDIASMDAGTYIDLQAGINIPEKLGYSQTAKIDKNLSYVLNGQQLVQNKSVELKTKDQTMTYNMPQAPSQNEQGNAEESNSNGENNESNTNEQNNQQQQVTLDATVETSLGTKKLSENDTVYGGEIIKNTITLKNTSNVDLKNVKVKANQSNAVIYDIVEVKVTNPSETGNETDLITQHNYGDWTTNEKTFDTIETIKAGESKEISYQARINEVKDNNQSTYGTITINADGLEEETKETVKNKIVQGKVEIPLNNSYNEELERYDGESVTTTLRIKNISGQKQNNVKVDIQLPENYIIEDKDEDIKFYYNTDWDEVESSKITNLIYNQNKNLLTFNITELGKDDNLIIIFYPVAQNKDKSVEYETANVSANVTIGNDEYNSNVIQKKIYNGNQNITVNYLIKNEKEQYNYGDEITFLIKVENKGKTDEKIEISNEIDSSLDIVKAKINNNGQERELDDEISDNVLNISEENISPEKIIEIEVTTKVNYSEEDDTQITNTLSMITQSIDDPIEKELNINLAGYASDDNNDENEDKVTISGIVWNDKNKDGKKDETEDGIENIEVELVTGDGEFVKDDDGNTLSTKTNSYGEYQFDVDKGRYMVVFLYDNKNYAVTEYQKDGVDANKNSDVISKEATIDGKKVTIAITDIVDASKGSVKNIDAGLFEKQKFDLKLDKYITKVSVQNAGGTKQYDFGREQLAKVEIKAKQFIGSTLAVEYQIQITNEGDIDGFVNDVIDYIPEGFKFNSELNKDWYIGTDKNLHSSSLENEQIKAGETKTLDLVLTTTLTQSNGQTLVNTSEIYKATNKDALEDIDSIPGNKKNGEDDISSATLLVALSTGIGKIFIGSILIVLLIIMIIVLVLKKKGGDSIEDDEK